MKDIQKKHEVNYNKPLGINKHLPTFLNKKTIHEKCL
jgi:hypothetical protein